MKEQKSHLDHESLQLIHKMSEKVAEMWLDGAPPDPIYSKEYVKKKITNESEKNLKEYFEMFAAGVTELMNSLYAFKKLVPNLNVGQMIAQLEHIGEKFGDDPEDTRSLSELAGISELNMAVFKEVAADLYNRQDYEKAAAVYFFLYRIEPKEAAFLLGYANSEFFLKHYEKALDTYQSAIAREPDVPEFYYFCAHCYNEMGDIGKAIESMDQAIQIIDRDVKLTDKKPEAEKLKKHFSDIAAANKQLKK